MGIYMDLANKYKARINEINKFYGFKDNEVEYVGVTEQDHRYIAEARFADGCLAATAIDKVGLSEPWMEVGTWLRRVIVEHGYKPKYASELHGLRSS